jgi:Protein of unknown function (DUF2800)
MSEHSFVVGGSSAERVLHCTGSIRLNVGPDRVSPAAEEGTALHHAMEYILTEDLPAIRALGLAFNGHVITEEHVNECLRPAVQAFEDVVGVSRFFEIEKRLPLTAIPGAFGTCDVVYFEADGSVAGIIDWKFGAGHAVKAADNHQMRFYLQSQLSREDAPRLHPDDTVLASIFQPRNGGLSTAEYRVGDLADWEQHLARIIAGPEIFERGSWCFFCRGKDACPEWGGRHAGLVQRMLDRGTQVVNSDQAPVGVHTAT